MITKVVKYELVRIDGYIKPCKIIEVDLFWIIPIWRAVEEIKDENMIRRSKLAAQPKE